MLKSSLWYYSNAYILVKGAVSIANIAGTGAARNSCDKK